MSLAGKIRRRIRRELDHPILYAGTRVECPICAGRFRKFRSHGGRPNAGCPRCGSLERHRLLWLYLTRETDVLSARLDVLHFAPEPGLANKLATLPNLAYLSADRDPRAAMVRADITALELAD